MRQERIASPSTSTVQAPQTPCSQPNASPSDQAPSADNRRATFLARPEPRPHVHSQRTSPPSSCGSPAAQASGLERPPCQDTGGLKPVGFAGAVTFHLDGGGINCINTVRDDAVGQFLTDEHRFCGLAT